MDLDPKDRRALDRTIIELQAIHGTALRGVVLWGEAASDAYRPRRSPLSIAIVLVQVSARSLRALAPHVRAWHRRRIGVPLLFDIDYLTSARDVFPLELLDLSDRHRLLWGDDPFASMDVDIPALRVEVEEQLRGKMLHLWSAYLAAGGSTSTIRRLLLESPAGFDVVLRGMLRLQGSERPRAPETLLATVERVFGLSLPALRELASVRSNGRRLAHADLEPLFETYLDEVRALVGTVDSW